MAVVVDLSDTPVEHRLEAWAMRSARHFEPTAIASYRDCPFSHALVSELTLGPVSMFHVAADPSVARRSSEMIGASDPECFRLWIAAQGRIHVAQEGRETLIGTTDIVGWQSSRPYLFEAPLPFAGFELCCPFEILRPRVDQLCRQTAERVDGQTGFGRVARNYLLALFDGLGDGSIDEYNGGALDAIIGIVRGLYAGDQRVAGSSEMLTRRMLSYTMSHLADPGLSAEQVARAHYVSPGYVRRLFARHGTSLSDTIRQERLERCARDLADPAASGNSILEIASRWGFKSAAHFSRAFRAAYGESPREYRREALARVSRHD